MWDFKLLKATQTLEKTMAYMIYRLAMYLVLSLILVFGILAGTGTGLILDSMFTTSSIFSGVGGFAGLVVFALVLYGFRGNWFFSMKAPHVALLNESIDEAFVQQGWAQVAHARSRIKNRFGSPAELHTLDKRIRAVLAYLFGRFAGVGERLSRLDNKPLAGFLARLVEAPAAYTHEVIIASCLREAARPASAVATRALVLYAQNFDRLLKNGLVLLGLKYAGAVLIFFLMLTPVRWVDGIIPVEFGAWTYVFALLFTWPVKSALFDPIVLAAMMLLFSEITLEQQIDSEWEARLAEGSPEFGSLQKQAEFLDQESAEPQSSESAEN